MIGQEGVWARVGTKRVDGIGGIRVEDDKEVKKDRTRK
jgi:hypothetical protein